MEQIPTEVMEIATMSNGLQIWKMPNKEVGGFIYYSEENGAPLPALVEALISIECLEIILNDMKKTQGITFPCALCEGMKKELAEYKEGYNDLSNIRNNLVAERNQYREAFEGKEKEIAELKYCNAELENACITYRDINASQSKRISELEAEKERLKGLIERAHTRGWLDFPEDEYVSQHISIESSWQQFKTENGL